MEYAIHIFKKIGYQLMHNKRMSAIFGIKNKILKMDNHHLYEQRKLIIETKEFHLETT